MTNNDVKTMLINDEVSKIVDELRDIRAEVSTLKEREELLKMKLQNIVGDSEILCDDDGIIRVTYKYIVGKRFNSKAFKEAEPTMYARFMEVTKQRKLLIK